MKYFVTGGAGFIGSHIVDSLIKQGHDVTVYDNLSSGKKDFIQHHLKNKKFIFVKNDILNFSVLKKTMKGHDFVFHLSANPDIKYSSKKETDLDLKQGTIATYNVLEAMRLNNVQKIAFASSSAVFGEPKLIPTPENYGPSLPISLYGASKLACEGLITVYSHLFGFKIWIFRFANIVGPRGTHGILFDFLNKIKKDSHLLEVLGDGKQKKSYLHVDDCVKGMFYVISKSKEQINVFNLGCNDQITVKKIVEIFVERLGTKGKDHLHGWKKGMERRCAGNVA